MSIELRPREIVVTTCERLRPIAYSQGKSIDDVTHSKVEEGCPKRDDSTDTDRLSEQGAQSRKICGRHISMAPSANCGYPITLP